MNRRRGPDRRTKNLAVQVERRSGSDRRLESSVPEQLQTVIDMLADVADSSSVGDEERRLLDTAIMRLRYAAEQVKASG
jgi:hypothetical protein